MSRNMLFALGVATAGLAFGVFVYTFWLRIIQTGDSTAEYWNPIIWVLALVFFVAGWLRKP